MRTMTCKALTTEHTMWSFCPSPGASILFTLLFIVTTCLHMLQAIYHRAWYSWVIIVSGLLQVATYLFRDLSIKYPANEAYYVLWFVLILIASVWTNAFGYMVFSRMLWRYHPKRSIFHLKAWHYGTTFVILDIFAFIVQIIGAAKAANPKATLDDVMSGLHIYMGGVGIQQIFIFGFCVVVLRFLWDVSRQRGKMDVSPALILGWTLIGALFFITVRIIFRLIEYSNGLKSSIPKHEGWQYGLDSLPMLIALVLFNIFHPGRLLPTHEVKIPSFFERRRQRKQGVDLEKNPNMQNAAEY